MRAATFKETKTQLTMLLLYVLNKYQSQIFLKAEFVRKNYFDESIRDILEEICCFNKNGESSRKNLTKESFAQFHSRKFYVKRVSRSVRPVIQKVDEILRQVELSQRDPRKQTGLCMLFFRK